jgi:NAD(P)-dependent dehydrogenase (short-subunit alcohol dehydrogenase family)
MGHKRLDLDGKVAVVIGGSSGIGRTLARGLAEAGADVVSSARRIELVNEIADEIETLGRRSLRVACDVTDRGSLEKVLQASVEALGKVDILVNAAGINQGAPTLDFSETDWNRIIDTNLTGTLRACQVFGRHMIERGYGRIINIASMGSFLALYEVAAYCASKAGVASLTKSLGTARSLCERNCAGLLPHTVEREIVGGNAARRRSIDPHANEPVRRIRRVDRSGCLSRIRCCQLRDRDGTPRGRRLSGQRG